MTTLLNPFVFGAGGGGGGYVQMATLRGTGTIALGASPTVGNLMVLVGAGFSTDDTMCPAGFSRIARYTNTNQALFCAARLVQSGDTGSYSLTGGSSGFSSVLYEFSGAISVAPIIGGDMSPYFSGTSFTLPAYDSPYGASETVIGAVEHDTSNDWTMTAATGMTVDYQPNDATNHEAAIFRLDSTHAATVAGSVATAVTNPVFGLFALVATGTPD